MLRPSIKKLSIVVFHFTIIGLVINILGILFGSSSIVFFVYITGVFGILGIFIALIELRNSFRIENGYLITIKDSKAFLNFENEIKIKIENISEIKMGSKYQPLANTNKGVAFGPIYNSWKRNGIVINSSNKSVIIETRLYDKNKVIDFLNLILNQKPNIFLDKSVLEFISR